MRAIRVQPHVGQPWAQRLPDYPAMGLYSGRKAPQP